MRKPLVQQQYEQFRVILNHVQHECSWGAAIVRKRTHEEIVNGVKEDVLYLECNKNDAQFICDSLNAAWKRRSLQ